MKLPFNIVLAPLLKPYLGKTRIFCYHPIFGLSVLYTYFYGTLGFFISANHLRKHVGERPIIKEDSENGISSLNQFMLMHDLKIIATSMGLVQYACLLVGCLTENPGLFLPHLAGQLVVVTVKILNTLFLLTHINVKTLRRLGYKIPAILMMTFNGCQEFCVFRQYLCVCDL